MSRKPYPSDVSDEEWAFVAPYLTLLPLDAGPRQHDLREVFNTLRLLVRTGGQWRFLPNDLPPWAAVYQQTQRWIAAGCFEAMVHDLRAVLRMRVGRRACSPPRKPRRHRQAAVRATGRSDGRAVQTASPTPPAWHRLCALRVRPWP